MLLYYQLEIISSIHYSTRFPTPPSPFKDLRSGVPFFCAPRLMLRRQVDRLARMGFRAKMATELEFHLFSESQKSARAKRWTNLDSAQPHLRCMHLLAGSVDEPIMQKIRQGLEGAGEEVKRQKMVGMELDHLAERGD